MFEGLAYQHRQGDGETCAFPIFAFHVDRPFMQVNDFLYICQSQSETFGIMTIASVNAIEFLKHLLQVVFLNANSRISDGEIEMHVVVPCLDENIERLVGMLIFYSVV